MEIGDFQFTDKKVDAKIQLKKICCFFAHFPLYFLRKKGGLLE